jgi:hypothetical protein
MGSVRRDEAAIDGDNADRERLAVCGRFAPTALIEQLVDPLRWRVRSARGSLVADGRNLVGLRVAFELGVCRDENGVAAVGLDFFTDARWNIQLDTNVEQCRQIVIGTRRFAREQTFAHRDEIRGLGFSRCG